MKDKLSYFVKLILRVIHGTFFWKNYDSNVYWKNRSKEDGQKSVLFKNEHYNMLVRNLSFQVLDPIIKKLPANSRVLDIGCGVGVVSRHIKSIRKDIVVDAVDFSEMIAVARSHVSEDINWIESSAETYKSEPCFYDFILSSGCISAIRDINNLEMALENMADMLKKEGVMLFLDPFHKWKFLRRAPYSSQDVISYLAQKNFSLIKKSGILFWPYRDYFANSDYDRDFVTKKVNEGERLLKRLGSHLWADYKVLQFQKV
ncbi:MAG: class I SAM-dependent methyltransferase [Alphaproteobacteria bacterium]|nr:class I SAM-dependent methyltransferase [Alphaproteobacteria bacterium]